MVTPWGEIAIWPYYLIQACFETIPGKLMAVLVYGWTLAGLLAGTTYNTINYTVALVVVYLVGGLLVTVGFKCQQFLWVWIAMLGVGGFWAIASRIIWWFIFRV